MMPDNKTVASLPPRQCDAVDVDPQGFVRVDGLCIGRRVVNKGQIALEFKDRNGARSMSRGAQLLRVPLELLLEALK